MLLKPIIKQLKMQGLTQNIFLNKQVIKSKI